MKVANSAVVGTVAWLKQQSPERRAEAMRLLTSSASRKNKKIAAAVKIVLAQAREMESAARSQIENARRRGCSMPRIEAYKRAGHPYRNPGMRLSRHGSRIGNSPGVLETQRWTPPQAVTLEDRYDAMDAVEAAACNDPPSVTGIQMQQIQFRKGRLEKQKLRTKRQNAA